jgi:GT2 family glycosyltransferase
MKRVELPAGADYARRGYYYMKNYGVGKLYRKAAERLDRNNLEKGYQEWMFARRPADSEKELQKEHRFAYSPLISIVVPVYRTPGGFLREMIESVLSQTYRHLELCLADGSEEDQAAETIIREYMRRDDRIKYQKLPKNLGISGNTNAGMAMASGEYMALLDHDDLLEEHALFEIVRWLQMHRDADMIYTDEDKVSFDTGNYFQPHFKPDFNPELLRSNNYICHLLVLRRDLSQKVGEYRQEYDGAQDYDFILRCSEQAVSIGHIPQILYHWRCHTSSTAGNPASKTYAYASGKRALEAHLERVGLEAKVEGMDNPGFYRVTYALTSVPKVCIVLLDVPGLDVLKRFVKALGQNRTYTNVELLLLLDTPEKNKLILNFIKEHRQTPIKVVYCNSMCNKFVTFSRLAEKLDSEYLLFLESRIGKMSEGFLETFLGNAQRPDTGAVGGRVYGNSHRMRYGAKVLGMDGLAGDLFAGLKLGYTGYFHKAVLQQNFHAVSGKAMMVRREYFLKVGGFSEDVEDRLKDVDLCLKLEQLGLRNIYEPGIVLIEQKYRAHRKKAVRPAGAFERKWKNLLLEPDRFYNCNLSLESHDCRIRESK